MTVNPCNANLVRHWQGLHRRERFVLEVSRVGLCSVAAAFVTVQRLKANSD